MQLIVTGRHVSVTNAMKNHAREKLSRILHQRPHINEVHVIMDVEKYRHRVELTVRGKNLDLFCSEETGDMYTSIDRALAKMERQLRRYKEKHLRKHKAHIEHGRKPFPEEERSEHEEPYIANRFAMKPMYFSEALLQMKVAKHLFFIFLNAETEEVNLLYKSDDAAIVYLEPKKFKQPGKRVKYILRYYSEDSIKPGEKPSLLKKEKYYGYWASPEEALEAMIMAGAKYRFFLNSAAENASIVYRQADGNYALIEPRK